MTNKYVRLINTYNTVNGTNLKNSFVSFVMLSRSDHAKNFV